MQRLRSFLAHNKPNAAKRALAAIWGALERLHDFPAMGTSTVDADIRQIVIQFGWSDDIARYAVLGDGNDVLVVRIWHEREKRP